MKKKTFQRFIPPANTVFDSPRTTSQWTAQAPASMSSNFYGDEEASSGKTCNGNMHKKRRRPATTTTKKKGLFPAFFRSPSFPFCGSPQARRLVPRANGEWVALQKNPLTYGKFAVWPPRMPLRVLVWTSRSFRTNRPNLTRGNVGRKAGCRQRKGMR